MNAPVIVNPTDREFSKHRYVLWFGPYGTTRLMIWADHLQEAFDHAVDWCVANAPGYLADDHVAEAFQEAKNDGKSDDEAWEDSSVDMSSGGNCGNYVPSWEWGMVAEDPTRAEVLDMMGAK